jgi:hypothetical protein
VRIATILASSAKPLILALSPEYRGEGERLSAALWEATVVGVRRSGAPLLGTPTVLAPWVRAKTDPRCKHRGRSQKK